MSKRYGKDGRRYSDCEDLVLSGFILLLLIMSLLPFLVMQNENHQTTGIETITISTVTDTFISSVGTIAVETSNVTVATMATETTDFPTPTQISVILSQYNEPIKVVNEAIYALMDKDPSDTVPYIFNKYRPYDYLEGCKPVKITYSVSGLVEGQSVVDAYMFLYVQNSAFDARRYSFGEDNGVLLYNLRTGTQYTYTVTVILSDGENGTASGSFTTMKSPRLLSITGCTNLRDIGGWDTVDGKTIKQGMVIRGGELDGAVEPEFRLSNESIDDFVDAFGIQFDMDLREYSVAPDEHSILGSDISHRAFDCYAYATAFSVNGKAVVFEVFTELAKRENYPIYMHCTYGVDRTGTICYLLEALLGMSEENLIIEYELTNAVYPNITQDKLAPMIAELNKYEGDTMQQKVESFLLSIGLSKEQLDTIKDIMLEPEQK